ncbi:YitT family protein [Maridesulfovibrio sp.]|uniref:YitT family protein n=1 Tax=Maridesulfovibrio sp. TaxID=2795000 RepID=UPI002A187713|nr:YitT family protein [Maridesulfovibrio sp.]
MDSRIRQITDSLPWNIFLLAAGAFIFIVGYNGIAAYHDFVPGALYGLAVVLQKISPDISLSRWYFLLNIPLFVIAWKGVSRRFFWLNLLTMGMITVMTSYVHLDLGIRNEMYAAIASGATMGAGSGVILRSYGGGGGLDVVAIILNRRYGVRFGVFYFVINALVMGFALSRFTPDKIVASLVMLFISSILTEYVLSMFNQRKAVRILSRKSAEIIHEIIRVRKMHATLIPAKGGYSGEEVNMIYSITDNLRLRSLEQLVFDIDPQAIFVVENTFSVIGSNINRRKAY